MKVSQQQVYTSVACNRTPEIVDWNNNGLICYGARNAVIVYDPDAKDKDSVTVLCHHQSKVNSVKWLQRPDKSCTELLSCSADKTAVIWTLDNEKWNATSRLSGHTDGVTCVCGIYTEGDNLLVYSGSIDSSVCVWQRINGTSTLKQKIDLHSGLSLTLQAYILPSVNKPILFCALDDHKVHIFIEQEDDQYRRVHMLIGHEDWVRGIDVLKVDESTLMLASASQDTYIRLWRIHRHEHQEVTGIKVEEKTFEAYDVKWSVKLEAVLAGHEGWVYGIQWQKIPDHNTSQPVYRLLSSSLDKTLIIWQPETYGGAWVESVRVGEVGGNGLGFYGSRFGPNAFLGHGYNGSLHIWKLDKESGQWKPSVVVGGHFSDVEDIRWEPNGRYLVSVSLDQTTRIHAPWLRSDGCSQWYEIARPQVHGYDMASITLVSPTRFVSAAEEKVLRVFEAPHNFLQNFSNIVGQPLVDDGVKGPEGASVPSLGLSNKAVFNDDDRTDNDDNDGYFIPMELHEPPTEETLMQNTLWPEVQKLYGHGYEVFCVDASHDGTLLASACKATVAEHAAVLIWETKSWQQIQKLISHQLTVTQLAFSPDSQKLVSVSRDRKWSLFQREEGLNSFKLAACSDKKNGVHSRIIWCCAWGHDSNVFATGSRDGKVCVWSKTEAISDSTMRDYSLLGKALELATSVTALAFAPTNTELRIVGVGMENGLIKIYGFNLTWTLLHELDSSVAHHLTVKRLFFKPRQPGEVESDKEIVLASCGSDNFVRINKLNLL